jgi:hypothetical protein
VLFSIDRHCLARAGIPGNGKVFIKTVAAKEQTIEAFFFFEELQIASCFFNPECKFHVLAKIRQLFFDQYKSAGGCLLNELEIKGG